MAACHGPINKRVWGSYAPRKVMLPGSRASDQAGFCAGNREADSTLSSMGNLPL